MKTIVNVGKMSAKSAGPILAIALGASPILFPLNVAIAQRVQTAVPTDGSVLPFPPLPSASIAAPRLQELQSPAAAGAEPSAQGCA